MLGQIFGLKFVISKLFEKIGPMSSPLGSFEFMVVLGETYGRIKGNVYVQVRKPKRNLFQPLTVYLTLSHSGSSHDI